MFLCADESVVKVKPGFELVANVVVSFARGSFSAVFQVKIIVGLSTFEKSVGKVRRKERKTESATNSDNEWVVEHTKFLWVGGDGP